MCCPRGCGCCGARAHWRPRCTRRVSRPLLRGWRLLGGHSQCRRPRHGGLCVDERRSGSSMRAGASASRRRRCFSVCAAVARPGCCPSSLAASLAYVFILIVVIRHRRPPWAEAKPQCWSACSSYTRACFILVPTGLLEPCLRSARCTGWHAYRRRAGQPQRDAALADCAEVAYSMAPRHRHRCIHSSACAAALEPLGPQLHQAAAERLSGFYCDCRCEGKALSAGIPWRGAGHLWRLRCSRDDGRCSCLHCRGWTSARR